MFVYNNKLYITGDDIPFRFLIKSTALLNNGKLSFREAYSSDIYSITKKIELQLKLVNNTIILCAKNDNITDISKLSDYNKLHPTDDSNIYANESLSFANNLSFCNNCSPCLCFEQTEVGGTVKCIHKCICSNQYPSFCWRPKFKYTVNIATREIHLYAEFA